VTLIIIQDTKTRIIIHFLVPTF